MFSWKSQNSKGGIAMGASYSVDLTVSLTDEQRAAEIVRKFIQDSNAEFNVDAFNAIGIGTDTFDNLMRIVLAGWESTPVKIKQVGGCKKYSNDFDATYGWESVVIKVFEALVPVLRDGSTLDLSADNEYVRYIVTDGKLVQRE